MAVVVYFVLFFALQSMAETLHKGRRTLTERDMKFIRGQLNGYPNTTRVKLILGTKDEIYAGGGNHLSYLNFQRNHDQALVKTIPIECKEPNCGITVMQPGRDEYPLFVCTAKSNDATCCYKGIDGTSWQPTPFYGGGEPALLTDCDPIWPPQEKNPRHAPALYTTKSDVKYGIYRKRFSGTNDNMIPLSSRSDQKYVKIVERRNKQNPLQDKLYAFYTEKNLDQNPDSDIFIPRVSQICMADLGGSKNMLQFQWTSQLSSRLSCGDSSRKLYYTELLDVAVLESEDGQDSRVYGLFTNGWKMRAVCVYAMKKIDAIFKSNLTTPRYTLSGRPGECVQDSKQLPSDLLRYMKNNPEMEDWVWPTGNSTPILVSHRHYSHIQVDRVGGTEGHNVLLLSMESGAVHKVLENSSEPFIIAAYHPFKAGTPIRSMLLDSSEKKLYVSSSTEVVQIDLRNCSVYGDQCADCVLARDPYCGWDSVHKTCSPYSEKKIQDVLHGDLQYCESLGNSAALKSSTDPRTDVSESSQFYMSCPVHSLHAEYRWIQDGMERQSIMDSKQEQLVLLIDGMRSADVGLYQCEAREGDYRKTVVQYELRMISGVATLRSSLALAPLPWALLVLLFNSLH